MPVGGIIQPQLIYIDGELRLRKPDQREWKKALIWYQDPDVLYYSEGVTDRVYNIDNIYRMYNYLGHIGELYFIDILEDGSWVSIGDAALASKNMPIAIGDKRYWGKRIGTKVASKLIERAKEIGISKISLSIYNYNYRSQKLYQSMGFVEVDHDDREKSYQLTLK